MWNNEKLFKLVQNKLEGRLFVVVSNREPYVHTLEGGALKWHKPVSGLTEALDPVMRAAGGTWIAQGGDAADRKAVDENNRVNVPPDDPAYTLRRVWLTDEDNRGFYTGFANSALWPLCHIAFTPPVFRDSDWRSYQKVNRIFADAVLEEIGRRDAKAIVLVQDYHFALLPRYLKEKGPDLTVGQFWHIPWPPYEVFRACPWREEIVAGMLGNDLLGFHVGSYCKNFIDTAKRSGIKNITTKIGPFPISVDFEAINEHASSEAVTKQMDKFRRMYKLEGKIVGVGMDRLDYTKGIPERLRALDKFLEANPDYRGKVVFIEAGMPSRTEIDVYQGINATIEALGEEINARWSKEDYRPVIQLNRQLFAFELNALRRLAHFCIVSSLDDGMNLVAKEFAAARKDEDGVLILSRFTGAAEELTDALLVNPFDVAGFAQTIKDAIEMPDAEKRRRMRKLRRVVTDRNIYKWGADIVSNLVEIAKS